MTPLRKAVQLSRLATPLGIQAAQGRQGVAGLRRVHGPAAGLRHHHPVGPDRSSFEGRAAGGWASRLRLVRGFARRRPTDPRTGIPPAGLCTVSPKPARAISTRTRRSTLLQAALALPGKGWICGHGRHCLFGLLSVAGLRLGEARQLTLPDVDLRAGVLTIQGAKFWKVPV